MPAEGVVVGRIGSASKLLENLVVIVGCGLMLEAVGGEGKFVEDVVGVLVGGGGEVGGALVRSESSFWLGWPSA